MPELLSVHDPRGYPPKVTGKRLAPRLAGLDGKIVYLVDCLFDNSAVFMEQLRQWFAMHLPAVNTQIITPRECWRARAGSTIWICARRSRPTAMPPSSVSGFEAPVARRSSG